METAEAESQRRLDQFVDAAFAFAVTLLVIAGAQPPETLDDLRAALLNLPASAGAFALIVLFWTSHRRYGRLTERPDTISVILSLAIVFTVLAYVYPLRLLTRSAFYFFSGGRLPGEGLIDSYDDLFTLFQVYGLGFALLSGLFALLFARAIRTAASPAAREDIISWRDPWLVCMSSGLLSAGLASAPFIRAVPWLPPFTYWLIPVAIWIIGWRKRRTAAKASIPA